LNFLKRTISHLLLKCGYRIVPADDYNSNLFQNLANVISAYEYLFKKYRNHELIPSNANRTELTAKLLGTAPSEAYFIIEAICKTKDVHGDICEFGVAQGETSALIANEIRETNKKLHLFDSFAGLPKPSAEDELKDDIFGLGNIEKYEGTMSCSKNMVLRRLNEIIFDSERYVLHEGYIEKSIHKDQHLPQKVSFAYIDFDFYEPILVALHFLHDVTPEGGIFIVDDYDFFSTGVKAAVEKFIDEKNRGEEHYKIEIPNKHFGCFAILYKVK
jgi:O-methyltransferase